MDSTSDPDRFDVVAPSLTGENLPNWAIPYGGGTKINGREEKITYAIHTAFKTKSDRASYVYGPEAEINCENIDLIINDIGATSGEMPNNQTIKYIGIEIKRNRSSVQAPSSIKQFQRYAKSGALDCIYLCVPAWVSPIPDTVPVSMGVIMYDPSDGSITVHRRGATLDRNHVPDVAATGIGPESATASKLYTHYATCDSTEIAAEVSLPSTRAQYGTATSIKPRTIDFLVHDGGNLIGIETKAPSPDYTRLGQQLNDYLISPNLDRLYVAISAGEPHAEMATYLKHNYPNVGLLSVSSSTPDRRPSIEETRPSNIEPAGEAMWECPECGVHWNEGVINEDRECPNFCSTELW